MVSTDIRYYQLTLEDTCVLAGYTYQPAEWATHTYPGCPEDVEVSVYKVPLKDGAEESVELGDKWFDWITAVLGGMDAIEEQILDGIHYEQDMTRMEAQEVEREDCQREWHDYFESIAKAVNS